MSSKKSQLSLTLILIPYSFASFEQKMDSCWETIHIFNLKPSHVAMLQNQAGPDGSSGWYLPSLAQTQAPETSLDPGAEDLTSQFVQNSSSLYLLS